MQRSLERLVSEDSASALEEITILTDQKTAEKLFKKARDIQIERAASSKKGSTLEERIIHWVRTTEEGREVDRRMRTIAITNCLPAAIKYRKEKYLEHNKEEGLQGGRPPKARELRSIAGTIVAEALKKYLK